MQPLSSFNDNLGVAILLTGQAGAGKTALAMRLFPKTYVFVADLNFKSGKDYLTKLGEISNVVGYDTATPDESGKPVTANLRFDRMLRCLNDALKSPEVETVVIDSATFIEDMIKAKICGATDDSKIRLDGFKQWGDLMLCWKGLIMQLRQSGKRVVMTSHENKEKDESDQTFKYQIAVDGSIRGKLPALFSDVWRCEVVEQGIGAQAKHVYQIRTLGNIRQEHLKNTYGMPATLLHEDAIKTVRGNK